MGDFQVILRLRAGKELDRAAFERMVEEKYLPVMVGRATRAGMVTEMVLLGDASTEQGGDYWLHVRWNGIEPKLHWVLPEDDSEAAQQLLQMGVKTEHVATHRILAARQSSF